MNDKLLEYCKELEKDILNAYEQGTTIPDSEKLAAKFLHAQMILNHELSTADLDRRMRKRGVKAIKSAVRVEEIKKHDKKPTEGSLEDVVNLSSIVASEESSFDEAEVLKEELDRYFGIFHEAHLYFRTLMKSQG